MAVNLLGNYQDDADADDADDATAQPSTCHILLLNTITSLDALCDGYSSATCCTFFPMRISASALGYVDLQRMVMLSILSPDSSRKPMYLQVHTAAHSAEQHTSA
jgi:hypothetical protein